jgi:hypothetical protein
MRRHVSATVLTAVLAASGAACSTGGGNPGEECAETDPAVVKKIMKGARTDFRPVLADGRPGVQVDHLEALESVVGQLPERDRKFGADQLVVLQVKTFLGAEDASEGLGSFNGPVYFALDADGELLGPAGTFTASLFDLPAPKDPEWLAWGDKVETSTLGNDLFGCVNPSS